MRDLTVAQWLEVWEHGLSQPAFQRPLLLLAAVYPEQSPESLARLSIGQRDACLLTLRERTFGSSLTSLTACPHCGERAELSFTIADIRATTPVSSADQSSELGIELGLAGYKVAFRLPNSLDLAAVSSANSVEAARNTLLTRCVLSIQGESKNDLSPGEKREKSPLPTNQLPEQVASAIIERMAQLDPQADTQLAMRCPACERPWQATFDIAAFFWSELDVWAQRLLREVHTLALAYGWREADILAMSSTRRQAYLTLLAGA